MDGGWAEWFSGITIETTGEIDRDDGCVVLGAALVDPIDELVVRGSGWIGKPGAEQGIDDDDRSPLEADVFEELIECGAGVFLIDGENGESHGVCDLEM